MNNKLSRTHTVWSLLRFAFPTIIMMIFMSLYSIVDGIFVSRLIGTDALSAVNIVYPLLSIVIAIGIMLSTGGSAVIAREMGEGRFLEAKQDFSLIIITGIVLGVILTITGFVFIDPLLRLLGANDEIFQLCKDYAKPLLWFTVAGILQMLFQMFFVTAGKPIIGLVVTIMGGLANMVLDYVLIAVCGWGIAGAAVATGVGFMIPAMFGMLWFLFYRKGTLCLVPPVWRKKVILRSTANGASELVTNLSAAVITYMFNIIMMRNLGVDGVAAITIVLYAEFMLIAVYLGYSSGVAPIFSYNHGEKNITQLKRLFKISIYFLLVCAILTFMGAIIFAEQIVGIFSPKGTFVFTLAVQGYYLYSISYLFKGINIFASSMFTAISDGKTSAILSLLRTLVFIVLGMLILPKIFGVNGVWLAVPFAEILSLILSLYFFRKQFKEKWTCFTE